MANRTQRQMRKWKFQSSTREGLHKVIAAGRDDCRAVTVYRLNLASGSAFCLKSGKQEMNAVLIRGAANAHCAAFSTDMRRFDSFYIPSATEVSIDAHEDCVFFIGAADCDSDVKAFFRRFDADLPLGDIHQIHGAGAGRREVQFTVSPSDPASRLICGLTWSNDGGWTSWPPHQHEKDLEEVYCYFDIEPPRRGFHISYLEAGGLDDAVFHTVSDGTMVLAPRGYHPTVAAPGTVNGYFWVLAAFSRESKRYDLAVNDPNF